MALSSGEFECNGRLQKLRILIYILLVIGNIRRLVVVCTLECLINMERDRIGKGTHVGAPLSLHCWTDRLANPR
jgi:hypothetical protein